MKKAAIFLAAISLAGMTSCSQGESPVEVSVSGNMYYVVPSKATSCYARRSASGTTPTPDVEEAYFAIPKLTFKINNPARITVISSIKVYYTPPKATGEKTEAWGADQLAALNQDWYSREDKVAVIPVNPTDAQKKTDCPMYVGGLNTEATNYTSSGSIKVYGYTQDPDNENDIQGFSTTTFFTYGAMY